MVDQPDPTPPEPLSPWPAAPDGAGGTGQGASADPARAFFNGKHVGDLGLGDAVSTAFRVLRNPGYVVPLLVVSMVVTLTLDAALGPILADRLRLSSSAIQERLPLLISSYVVALVGGLLAATYGQVWLIIATRREPPAIGEAVQGTLDRWLAVLVSGLLTGLLLALVFVPFVVVVRDLVVVLVLTPLLIYLGSRLSFATWLAADGRGPVESVRLSWSMSNGQVLRIVGWSLAFGLLIGILSALVGLVLDRVPIGAAALQGVTTAMQFGFGIALYRKVEAEARDPKRDPRGYL